MQKLSMKSLFESRIETSSCHRVLSQEVDSFSKSECTKNGIDETICHKMSKSLIADVENFLNVSS